MKTLQEVYDAIMESDELKKGIRDAMINGRLETFLKEQGCESTKAEFDEFIKEKAAKVSDEDLAAIAGGSDRSVIDPPYSNAMPWVCNPNYSTKTGKDGGKIITLECM